MHGDIKFQVSHGSECFELHSYKAELLSLWLTKHQNNLHVLHCFTSSCVVIQNYSHYQTEFFGVLLFCVLFKLVHLRALSVLSALFMLKTSHPLPESIQLLSNSHTQMLLHLIFEMLFNPILKTVRSAKIQPLLSILSIYVSLSF